MKTILSKARNWWWLISVVGLFGIACKTQKDKQSTTAPPATMEYPKPAAEQQTDSLKQMLDAERAKKLEQKKP